MNRESSQLTLAQEELIPVYRDKWQKIALSTQPINRQKAEAAVKAVYHFNELPEPEVYFFDSSLALVKELKNICFEREDKIGRGFGSLSDDIQLQIDEEFGEEIDEYLYAQLSEPIRNLGGDLWSATFSPISLELWSIFNKFLECVPDPNVSYLTCGTYITQEEIGQACLLDYYFSGLNTNYSKQEEWEIYESLILSGSWFLFGQKKCLVCDRPSLLSFNLENWFFHAEGVPAIEFADGVRVYIYQGVVLPEKYTKVHPDRWRSEWLIDETNAELRRVLISAIGYERLCQELEAEELDGWQEYTLLKITREVDIEPIHLLKMNCPSTERIHVLRVPPNITSAREAIRWGNWDIDPEDFLIQT